MQHLAQAAQYLQIVVRLNRKVELLEDAGDQEARLRLQIDLNLATAHLSMVRLVNAQLLMLHHLVVKVLAQLVAVVGYLLLGQHDPPPTEVVNDQVFRVYQVEQFLNGFRRTARRLGLLVHPLEEEHARLNAKAMEDELRVDQVHSCSDFSVEFFHNYLLFEHLWVNNWRLLLFALIFFIRVVLEELVA